MATGGQDRNTTSSRFAKSNTLRDKALDNSYGGQRHPQNLKES